MYDHANLRRQPLQVVLGRIPGTWNIAVRRWQPQRAGSSALVREYLMEVIGRQAPQGSLVKALLILGAKDMGARDIPNDDEGWGRVDLVNSLIPDGEVGIFVDDRSRIRSGQIIEYTFDVNSAGKEFKAVLTWSDYPDHQALPFS